MSRLPNIDVLTDCTGDMKWKYKNGSIEVLYPFEGSEQSARFSSNNHSCVVRYTVNDTSFLLMGDLEGNAELALVKHYKQKLKADVLISGHHGSKNATSYALLKNVKPRVVVFSSGYFNRFGHPHRSVIDRVKGFGAEIYITSKDGGLVFDVAEDKATKLKVLTLRNEHSPFWVLR